MPNSKVNSGGPTAFVMQQAHRWVVPPGSKYITTHSAPRLLGGSMSWTLNTVDSIKYLGVMLSNDTKDDADMNRHLRSFFMQDPM